MGYSKQAIIGVSWMTAFRVVTRIIAFVRIIILARLLVPSQFGIFGIASLVLIFLEILTETGINVFLVQKKEDIEKYIDTSWMVSIARGILMSLVIIMSTPLIIKFYNVSAAYSVLLVAALVPLVRGFINPSVAKFQKDLKFNKQFYYNSSQFFVESLATIIIIFFTRSPIGLVWGLVVGAVFEVFLSFFAVKPLPKPVFNKSLFAEVLSRGKWVTISGVFSYFFQNGDNIVVGKMIGISALGIYDMTYRISILPITEVADVISKVTFPVYVKISHDLRRLKWAFLKTILTVSFLCVPIGFIFFVFPKEIIVLLLGSKWIEAIPVLQILAIFGVIRAISGISTTVFLSVKKQEYAAIVMFISFLILAITIVPLVKIFGLVGAGISALAASVAALPVIVYFLMKIFSGKSENKLI